MNNFSKMIRLCLGVAILMIALPVLMIALPRVISGAVGSSVWSNESVNNILNGIVLENYDYISGKALFKNGAGQEIVYDSKSNSLVDSLTGYIKVSIGNETVKLNPISTEALRKAMPNRRVRISNLKSENDLVSATDEQVAKYFIDYLISNDIYKIKFIGYSPDTKTITYNDLDNTSIVTVSLGKDGFYKIAEVEDKEASDSKFVTSLIFAPILAILLFISYAAFDEDSRKVEDNKAKKVSNKVNLTK